MAASDKLLLQCSCSCSILTIEKDEELNQYFVALFKGKFGWKLGFLERLRWIKNILLTGNIWTDNVVLEQKDIIKLKKFLDKQTKKKYNR